jgi:P-type Cu+ transporter
MCVESVNTGSRRILPGSNRHDARRSPMAIETDPVCGMQVDTQTTDLKFEHDGTTYWFCGKGCLLEFRDDPEKYLAPDYQPSM